MLRDFPPKAPYGIVPTLTEENPLLKLCDQQRCFMAIPNLLPTRPFFPRISRLCYCFTEPQKMLRTFGGAEKYNCAPNKFGMYKTLHLYRPDQNELISTLSEGLAETFEEV